MKIQRSFFLRDTLTVAPELLGLTLVHNSPDGITKGTIMEVEAYKGLEDAAAHVSRAGRTQRTAIQFEEGGYAYVYMIYGLYYCLNIVVNKKEIPETVLIRSLEPLEGIPLMRKRRKTNQIQKLCDGPGKMCQAMGITKALSGTDICGEILYLETNPYFQASSYHREQTPRIGIAYAGEAQKYPWRFLLKSS